MGEFKTGRISRGSLLGENKTWRIQSCIQYVTAQMYRQTEEEIVPAVGLPRHRHFVGYFNVPVLHPTVIPRNRPI